MKDNLDCSIIIISRDVSLDMVKLSVEFWKKFWPSTKYNRFLCTEYKPTGVYDQLNVFFDDVFVTGNTEYNYLQRVAFALDKVKTKYVILLLEDFFLSDFFSDEKIEELILFSEKENAGAIQLQRLRRFSSKYNKDYNIILPTSLYRITTAPTFYKTEYIKRFMELKCTPWQFERKATRFSSQFTEKVFCTKQNIYPSVHGCSEKKWFSDAIKLFNQCEISEELWNHKVQYPIIKEKWIAFRWYILCLFPHIINYIQEKRADRNEKKVSIC